MREAQVSVDSEDGSQRNCALAKASAYTTVSFEMPRLPCDDGKDKRHVKRESTAVEKRAIWIVHGMGQQVPFETLDGLSQGVLLAAATDVKGWRVSGPPRVASVEFLSSESPSKSKVVQRVEIELHSDHGNPHKLELHLYEAYWAPLTEGVAKVSDVMSFLFDGGLHGLLNWWRPFRRAMFPDDQSPSVPNTKQGKVAPGFWNFRIPRRSALYILAALLLVLALVAIDSVIVAASAAHLKFPIFGSWPISDKWNQLTAIATAVVSIALAFGAVLFLAEMSRPADAAKRAVASLVFRGQELVWFLVQKLPFSFAMKSAPRPDLSKTSESTGRRVDSWWERLGRGAVRRLSWFSLGVVASVLLLGAICLALISVSPSVADWFRGMHYRATQFVSTVGILVASALCISGAWRRAILRSRGVDHHEDVLLLVLFASSFLLQIGLLALLITVQYFRFFEPNVLPGWQKLAVNLLGWPGWVWPSMLLISKLVRDLMVEYPGDVAIYVTSTKVDRFEEIREKIKQLALDSLMPLYFACHADSAGKPNLGSFVYSKVAVIGHSLGSVVAYDTLNKLLTLDYLLDNQFCVAERTSIFETFGSPLDKTAYLFSFQGKERFRIREELAASKQPLIESYSCFRKFPWINVHSRSDIISGELKFYDVYPPKAADPPTKHTVDNRIDPDAVVPLIAHVEYWKNLTVWRCLLDEVTRPANGGAPPMISPTLAASKTVHAIS